MQPADLALHCDDLSVSRAGVRVAEGITLRVPVGGAAALMGPTGAGKSSVAALLAGVEGAALEIVGGRAWVAGVPLRPGARGRRLRAAATGYLAQGAGAALPARSTIAEVIGEPLAARGRRVNPRALALRVANLLDELALPLGLATRYPYELSSGMRQRVALARALALEPALFIGDDPYANLDLDVRRAARDALLRRRDARGMGVLVVTNDPETVRELDADVLVLRAGHPIAAGHGTSGLLWTPDGGAPLAS